VQCFVINAADIFCSYLKSFLRYKYLSLDRYCLDTQYLCEQACEDVWLCLETERGLQAKEFGKHYCMLVIFAVECQAVGKAWCGKGMVEWGWGEVRHA
jgi:hypothetical protein